MFDNEENLLQKAQTDFANGKCALAEKKLKKLMAKNNAEAFCLMGDICQRKDSGYYNLDQSLQYYEKAAEMGCVPAMAKAGQLCENSNPQKAIQFYRKGTEHNDPCCLNRLGHMECSLSDNIPDYARAIQYFESAYKACHADHVEIACDSAYVLGLFFWIGAGTDQDYGKAVDWFEKAAENNSRKAYYYLAQAYRYGHGKVKDYEKAKKYYHAAAYDEDCYYDYHAGLELAKWYFDELNDWEKAMKEFEELDTMLDEFYKADENTAEEQEILLETQFYLAQIYQAEDAKYYSLEITEFYQNVVKALEADKNLDQHKKEMYAKSCRELENLLAVSETDGNKTVQQNAGNGRKVLLADDTPFMREMLRDILTKAGYQIVGEAQDGKYAVQLYKRWNPDVVLMDITMPEMDGIGALKEIRKEDPNAYIIMCAAMGQQAMVIEAIQNGAKDFVNKPFDSERVLEAVGKAF